MKVVYSKNEEFNIGDVFSINDFIYLICHTKELLYFTIILSCPKLEHISKVSKKNYDSVEDLLLSYKNNKDIKKLNVKLLIE